MRSLMRSLAPDCFEDVAALVALYRPGPMAANMHTDYADRKNGRAENSTTGIARNGSSCCPSVSTYEYITGAPRPVRPSPGAGRSGWIWAG